MPKTDKPIVLLVDDNEATCTLVTAILQRELDTEIASDGAEAVEKLKTKDYAAVLLDIRMPGLDGYGVLDFIKTTRPEMLRRVVVLTASLSQKELERVRAYDICGVIAKPFEVETLLGAIKECTRTDGGAGRFFASSGFVLLLAEVLRGRWL